MHSRPLKRPYRECDQWTANNLARIVDDEEPAFVVASGRSTYRAVWRGHELTNKASATALERGYVDTLRQLTDAGSPCEDVPACVSKHLDRSRDCAFERDGSRRRKDASERAVAAVSNVRPIDPIPVLCRAEVCPAVAGDVVVYEQTTHLTATYVETMAEWLGNGLPQ